MYIISSVKPWQTMLKMATRMILLLYRNGEEWQRVRQAVAPKVMRPKVLEENIDDFNCVAEDTIEWLEKIKVASGQDGEVPDLEGELKKWSTESRCTGLQVTVSRQSLANQICSCLKKFQLCLSAMSRQLVYWKSFYSKDE